MDNEKIKLNDFIIQHFSLGELRDLCFQLGLDSDDLDGNTRSEKARELIEYLRRRGRLADLHVLLKRLRAKPYVLAFPTVTTTEIAASSTPGLERDPRLPPGARATSLDRHTHAKTGIVLIRIPAGPFIYGEGKDQKTIDLPEYWIGRAPVTNVQFARFVQATGHRTTAEIKGQARGWTGNTWDWIKGADWRHLKGSESSIQGKDQHPVVQVSWSDAFAFCNWARLILPSEEQWEKAARGTDGRHWPWGDEPPTNQHYNHDNNVGTTPVGRYSPRSDSPYGCVDMAGNVWEWTRSWYTEGKMRAVRGGSWNYHELSTRAASRDARIPDIGDYNVGYRVVELLSDPGF